jgi:hypothetical protein
MGKKTLKNAYKVGARITMSREPGNVGKVREIRFS